MHTIHALYNESITIKPEAYLFKFQYIKPGSELQILAQILSIPVKNPLNVNLSQTPAPGILGVVHFSFLIGAIQLTFEKCFH